MTKINLLPFFISAKIKFLNFFKKEISKPVLGLIIEPPTERILYLFIRYYFFNKSLINQFITLIIKAPKNAGQNPATANPFTTVATNQNNKALITKVNKPKVKIFTGKVKNTNIGFNKAFNKPNNKAVIKAVYQPETEIPGK